MDCTFYLYCQLMFDAEEVEHETVIGVLASEFDPV